MAVTQTWKHSERTIARMLGLRRVGNTGQSTPDCIGGHLVVEVKHRKRGALARWVTGALAKVRAHAGPNKLGIVVVHTEGQRYGQSLVVMTLQDFADWYISPMAGASDEELAILAPDLIGEEAGAVSPQTPTLAALRSDQAQSLNERTRPANWGTSWDSVWLK